MEQKEDMIFTMSSRHSFSQGTMTIFTFVFSVFSLHNHYYLEPHCQFNHYTPQAGDIIYSSNLQNIITEGWSDSRRGVCQFLSYWGLRIISLSSNNITSLSSGCRFTFSGIDFSTWCHNGWFDIRPGDFFPTEDHKR
jgi:hypothetical protein